MKYFSWSVEKNERLRKERLRKERGVTFEEVVFHVASGGLLDVLEHPSRERYPLQRVMIVEINDYAYIIPFVEDEEVVFLKTIIPSRKMTRRYLGDA